MDFFTVPTVMFKVLFVFVVLAPERRRVVHINVTDPPTAQWTGQQLMEAFPWQTAPRYLLRDRDAVYGVAFSRRAQSMGIHEVTTAPRSPWQNPYVERLIGTLRRECLDHVVVLNETHLRRLLSQYLIYYHRARTHLSLDKDAPEPRLVERLEQGRIVETPMVGGSIIVIPARRRRILRTCRRCRQAKAAGRPVRAVHPGLPAPCVRHPHGTPGRLTNRRSSFKHLDRSNRRDSSCVRAVPARAASWAPSPSPTRCGDASRRLGSRPSHRRWPPRIPDGVV